MTTRQTFLNLPENKRDRITAVAVNEFATQGYAGASINRMIGRLKIAKGSIFQYFGDKRGLFMYVFDVAMEHSRWVVWLGSAGYAILIILNRLVNFFLRRLGRGNLSVASRIKDSMHRARRYTEKFEQIAVDLAREKGYDAVVCGHIHHAKISVHHDEMGRKILYLNSGDWIENLTALEYEDGAWNIHRAVRHVDVEPEEADAPEHGPQDGWQDRPAVGWNLSSCKAVDG